MIDKNMEPYYDIILSIFIGIIFILVLNSLYDMPRIIVINQTKHNNKLKAQCCDLNL